MIRIMAAPKSAIFDAYFNSMYGMARLMRSRAAHSLFSMTVRKNQILLAFLVAVLTVGCRPTETQNDTETSSSLITDALGRSFPTGKTYNNIITIAPGATEIVIAGGGQSRLIGISNVDSYPVEILDLPSFSVLPMDFEAIVALQPDLILASSQVNDPKQVDMFGSLGLDVFYLDGSTWAGVYDSIAHVGQLLGTNAAADSSRAALKRNIDHLTAITSKIEDKPTAVFLISAEVNYSFGSGSYVQDILTWAGMESLTASFDTPAPNLSDEWVLMANPDVIIGSFEEGTSASTLLEHHPTWKGISAIKNNRVYSIEPNTILRPGPRNVEAAFEIARLAYPELHTLVMDRP